MFNHGMIRAYSLPITKVIRHQLATASATFRR